VPELRNLDVSWVSLVDRAAVRDPSNPSEPQRFLVWKAESGSNPTPKEGAMPPTTEELTARVAKAESERDELNQRVQKLEQKLAKKGDKPQPAPVDKSQLAPEVRAMIEKAERDAEQTRKEADEAKKIAKAERDQRIEREFISKAETEFANMPGDKTELGQLLKTASEKLGKADYDMLEQRLRAADEQIKTGDLFKQFGQDGEHQPSSAEDTIARNAAELRKADPSLGEYEAMRQAARGDRNAQASYLNAVR
jgi:chromosome segregation ATPase